MYESEKVRRHLIELSLMRYLHDGEIYNVMKCENRDFVLFVIIDFLLNILLDGLSCLNLLLSKMLRIIIDLFTQYTRC